MLRILSDEEVWEGHDRVDAWWEGLSYRSRAAVRGLAEALARNDQDVEFDEFWAREHPRPATAATEASQGVTVDLLTEQSMRLLNEPCAFRYASSGTLCGRIITEHQVLGHAWRSARQVE